MSNFNELDPMLHSRLRLAVVSLLVAVEDADFNFLKEKTESTAGNLSVQLKKLEEAGYLTITKEFRNNFPHTRCKLTKKGLDAFEKYVKDLMPYLTAQRGKKAGEQTRPDE